MRELSELFWLTIAGLASIGLFIITPVAIFDHRFGWFWPIGLVSYSAMLGFSVRFYRFRRNERLAGKPPGRTPWNS